MMKTKTRKLHSPLRWIAAMSVVMITTAAADTVLLSSSGSFESLDGNATNNGPSYELGFVLDLDDPTAEGIPWSISVSEFSIDGTSFQLLPITDGSQMGVVTFGDYRSGTELFEPDATILGEDATTEIGTVSFDFYFSDGTFPLQLPAGSTGDDILERGLLVDVAPRFTAQLPGFSDAIGVSDITVVPEAGASTLLVLAMGLGLMRRSR